MQIPSHPEEIWGVLSKGNNYTQVQGNNSRLQLLLNKTLCLSQLSSKRGHHLSQNTHRINPKQRVRKGVSAPFRPALSREVTAGPCQQKARLPGILSFSVKNDCDELMVSLTGSSGRFAVDQQRHLLSAAPSIRAGGRLLGAWAPDPSPFAPSWHFREGQAICHTLTQHIWDRQLNSSAETGTRGEPHSSHPGHALPVLPPEILQLHGVRRKEE